MPKKSPRHSINYWIYAAASSLSKGAMHYYGKKFGVRVPEMRIISTLGSHGPLASRDLVKLTAMDKALVSRVLSTLASDGLVAQGDEGERTRLRRWALTKEGAKLVARLQPEWQAREARLQQDLTPEERELLVNLLERLFDSSESLMQEEMRILSERDYPWREALKAPDAAGGSEETRKRRSR